MDEENDKPSVIALREIAAGVVGPEVLHELTAAEHAAESLVAEEEPPESAAP